MRDQDRFDLITREVALRSSGGSFLLLDPDLRIRAASKAYERVTLRERGELPGQYLFDAFPDNPGDPHCSGASNLAASLDAVLRSGKFHHMRIQRYDVRDPAEPDRFLPKVWNPTNTPLLDHGETVGVVHRVEEITDSGHLLAELGRAVDQTDAWTLPELLHTFAAVTAVEEAHHCEREQALIAETEQLRCALESRDIIGQAKGVVMERFNVDATAAFQLLVKVSQNANIPVEQISRKLIAMDHPGSS